VRASAPHKGGRGLGGPRCPADGWALCRKATSAPDLHITRHDLIGARTDSESGLGDDAVTSSGPKKGVNDLDRCRISRDPIPPGRERKHQGGGGSPPARASESPRDNECAECCADFTSRELFDRHPVRRHDPDERRCLSVTEMKGRAGGSMAAAAGPTRPGRCAHGASSRSRRCCFSALGGSANTTLLRPGVLEDFRAAFGPRSGTPRFARANAAEAAPPLLGAPGREEVIRGFRRSGISGPVKWSEVEAAAYEASKTARQACVS
jgi:hypothetical protein